MMTSSKQSGPLLEMNAPFHSGNTFLDSLTDKQGNKPNLLRELKISSTSPLPFQSPNPILRNPISNSKWIRMNSGQSMTTLIHKTVPTYLKRLKKALFKRNQLNQVVLPTSADMDGFADLRSE
jgi:hypothetical protein